MARAHPLVHVCPVWLCGCQLTGGVRLDHSILIELYSKPPGADARGGAVRIGFGSRGGQASAAWAGRTGCVVGVPRGHGAGECRWRAERAGGPHLHRPGFPRDGLSRRRSRGPIRLPARRRRIRSARRPRHTRRPGGRARHFARSRPAAAVRQGTDDRKRKGGAHRHGHARRLRHATGGGLEAPASAARGAVPDSVHAISVRIPCRLAALATHV
eukprot:scaffold12635_cov111-Isochrysis_galbana.AAC.1